MVKKLLLLSIVPGFFVVVAWMNSPERMNVKELKIGSVDVARCFEKYRRVEDEKVALEAFVKKQKERGKEIEAQLAKLRADMKAYPADVVDLRKQTYLEIKRLETTAQVEAKLAEATYADMYGDAQVNMYNDIRKVIGKISEEQGYDLVLKSEETMLSLDSEESAARRISARAVMYASKGLDITIDVIERLNKEYKK